MMCRDIFKHVVYKLLYTISEKINFMRSNKYIILKIEHMSNIIEYSTF